MRGTRGRLEGRFASQPARAGRANQRNFEARTRSYQARKLHERTPMTEYHEPPEELDARSRDLHRALTSLKEEIEAVDWYGQRVARASNAELRSVLEHNRKEEIEHACMTLEWLRRECPEWDAALRTYLFQSGAIVEIEDRAGSDPKNDQKAAVTGPAGQGLGIGSLREVTS